MKIELIGAVKMKHVIAAAVVLSVLLACHSVRAAENTGTHPLENKQLRVVFDEDGLLRIHDKAIGRSIDFNGDRFVLKIDDQTIDSKTLKVELKKAYASVYRSNPKNTFLGFYADLSSLKPEAKHTVTVELPELEPGQFQGLFFDNIEPEHTTDLE
jgi:hypothetical protein